jgi:N-sulfoglucosamine sulfohydrolase
MRVLPTLLTLAFLVAGSAMGAERLNILFVFADDWGRYASAYAKADGKPSINDAIQTPNVDRLAREGALFRNAFVNAPSCTPCRSSLLSGRFFFNTGRGAILNGAEWDPAIPTFPLLLRDAGYHIGKSYKVWSPGAPVDAPFGEQKYAYEKAGRLPNNFSEETEKLLADGWSVPAAHEKILDQVRGNFDSFLADRKPDEPWLYFLGTTTTHRMWVKGSGKKHWGIDPETLTGKMPAFLPDVAEVREDVADYLGECQAVDACIGALLKKLEAAGELERTVIVVSGDHGMPGVPSGKCNLYDHGTRVTLAVRWPSSAGYPLNTGGRVIDDFVTLPDLAPTFMEIGGVTPPSGLYGRSIVPLLKSDKSGQIDATRTSIIAGRERHFGTAREGNLPYPMRALRTADFLYIRNFAPERWPMGGPGSITESETPDGLALEKITGTAFADMDASPTKAWLIQHRNEPQWKPLYDQAFGKRVEEEFYDLKKDPDQMQNVVTDPAYAAEKAKYAARLQKELTDAGDPRVSGDPVFDHPPFTDVGPPRGRQKAGPTAPQ